MKSPQVIWEDADVFRMLMRTNPILRLAYSLALKSFDENRSEDERADLRREALKILDRIAAD